MIALVVVVVVLVVAVVSWRRARKRRLVAGLVASRPGFWIEPPRQSVGRRKDGLL